MVEVLNYEEIKQKYDGEWVLIAYTEIDSQLRVIRGEVIAHSPDRDQVYDALSERGDRAVAIECFLKAPENIGFVR